MPTDRPSSSPLSSGGDWDDSIKGMAIDGSGNIYVASDTSSSDFPTTPDAFQRTNDYQHPGAFVAKLSSGPQRLSVLIKLEPCLAWR
jgi:hypothetical protein